MSTEQTRNGIKRRQFLRHGITGLAGAVPAIGWLGHSQFANAADRSGYKALVCIYLAGGNDAFNMIVPRLGTAYSDYANVRQSLAIDSAVLQGIAPDNYDDGISYGLHPAAAGLRDLFNNGNLAIVANVGTLVEPVTPANYLDRLLPPQLFSHNDQTDLWMLGSSGTSGSRGWAGTMMDRTYPFGTSVPTPSPNLSIDGNNLWQTGARSRQFDISPQGVSPQSFRYHDGPYKLNEAYEEIYNYGANNSNKLIGAYARTQRRSIDFNADISAALTQAPEFLQFSDSPLDQQLAMIARLIAVRDALGSTSVPRQTYFARLGGWDTHDNQNGTHPALLGQLSAAMTNFNAAMEQLGLQDMVTIFTASEFGRSLAPNNNGTDHGWGGHALVMGGSVRGKDIYGLMPQLALNSPDTIESGRVVPTTAVDQYGATLASWFGLSATELGSVFPHLARFGSSNLGFMT